LGWDAPWKALYIKALPPSSHYVIEFEWTFAEQRESYIVDPWGKLVQPYDDAVAYFRKNSGNGYTHSNTTFGHTQLNTHLEEAAYLENIKTAFDRFNIKEQLDAKIKAHKYKFVGMPE
jgi:hypothetical protein